MTILRMLTIFFIDVIGLTTFLSSKGTTPHVATLTAPEPIPGKRYVCAGAAKAPTCAWMSEADCNPATRYERGLRKVCAGKSCGWTGVSDTCDPRPSAPLPPGKIAVCDDKRFTNCRWENAKLWR